MAFYGLSTAEFDELTFEELRAYLSWMAGPQPASED
jgi:hypothetical protein